MNLIAIDNEQVLISLLNELKAGWWIRDDKNQILILSDFIQELIGWNSDLIPFDSFMNMIRKDYRERLIETYERDDIERKERIFPLETVNGTIWIKSKPVKRDQYDDNEFGYMQAIDSPEYNPEIATPLRTNNLLFQLNNISKILLSFLQTKDPDKIITEILKDILKQFKAGRTYIFEYDWEERTQTNTYEVVDENVKPEIHKLYQLPLEMNTWWTKQISKGNHIILSTLSDLPPEAQAEKEFLALQDINSLYVAPLISKDGVWGYAGIDIVEGYHTWTEEDSLWLSALINIISLCIQLYQDQQKLIDAKEKAEISDKLKTAFLANMTHEIRTPLNAIVGFSDLLTHSDEIAKEDRSVYAQIVQENNDLLLQLISDIFDLSKIESGTLDLLYDNINAQQLCSELIQYFQIKNQNHKVKISLEKKNPSCIIRTDITRLTQVIGNLINNALKFTTEGHISLSYKKEGNRAIKFYIKDTGTGIPKENQNQIFSRFIKLDSFTTGTGLGLTICKSLVELMGGEIGVQSEPGKGSCFWFTHPL